MENIAPGERRKSESDSRVESGDQHRNKKNRSDVAANYQPADSAQFIPLLDKAYNAIQNVESLDGLDTNIFSDEETKKLIANIKKNFTKIKASTTASEVGNSWSEIRTAARTNSHVRDALTYIIDMPAERAYETMRKTTLSPEIVNFADITDEGTKNLLDVFFSMSKKHGIGSEQAIAAWKDIKAAARTNSSISTVLDRIAQVSIRKARDVIQLAGGDPDILELKSIEDQNTKKAIEAIFSVVKAKKRDLKHLNKEKAWKYVQEVAKMNLQMHKALTHIAEIPYITAAFNRNSTRKLRLEYELLLTKNFVTELKKYVDNNTNPRSKRQSSNEVQRGETAQVESIPQNANRSNNPTLAFAEEISEIVAILYRTKVKEDPGPDLEPVLDAVNDLRYLAGRYSSVDPYAQRIIREFDIFDQERKQSQEEA
jgi:hypothetical protein